MPKLSPSFESAQVVQWHVDEGDELLCTDLIVDVRTDTLTDTDRTPRVLEIEGHEEGFVARVLHRGGGDALLPGTPLMVLCEESEDVHAFSGYTQSDADPGSDPDSEVRGGDTAREFDAGEFLYQAYTKKTEL